METATLVQPELPKVCLAKLNVSLAALVVILTWLELPNVNFALQVISNRFLVQ